MFRVVIVGFFQIFKMKNWKYWEVSILNTIFFLPFRYSILTTSRVTVMVLTVWVIASTAVGLQTYLDLGPNICKINRRKPFTMAIDTSGIISASVIVGAPMLFTILVYASLVVRVRSATRGSYKPPVAFSWDYELTKANIYSFFFFSIFWLPLGVAFCVSVVR